MSSIALRFGVQTSAIMAANPGVDPNAMSIGTKLVIPSQSGAGFSGSGATPIPLGTGPLTCKPSLDGGTWCFLLVQNNQPLPVENLEARIAVANGQTGQTYDQLSTAPLNILYPGKAMALSVYFPKEISGPFQSSYMLTSALAVQDGNNRYLDAKMENLQITQGLRNLSARVYGEVSLVSSAANATVVWVAGVAYDKDGNVVGVRRWTNNGPLNTGQRISFLFTVYSTGVEIAKVDVLLEARK